MNKRLNAKHGLVSSILFLLALLPAALLAQVPVDEDGNVIGGYEPQSGAAATGNEDIPLLSPTELEELVGPVALYPDDLLAIVLPASAYPLQVVEAARFLEELEDDPSLKPDPDWDDSVVALVNYPEVVELLNEDIDWTWRLGEAVVSQQADVVAAIESFRDRAYAAGNLKSDSYQNVTRNDGAIEISPVSEDVIYVPYYEPERVVVYQRRPVYYYYPRAYPVYCYPYSSAHVFDRGFFWGVTTAFSIGWYTDSLHVFHHSYHGHPYYGYRYWDRWWYRRPTINIYNTTYVGRTNHVTINRYYGGDRWRPRHDRRNYIDETRITRNRYYPNRFRDRDVSNTQRTAILRRDERERPVTRSTTRTRNESREPIRFRERPQNVNPRTLAINRDSSDRRQRSYSDRRQRSYTGNDARRDPDTTTSKRRRSEPTPKLQPRRVDPTPQVRRTEPTTRVRRAEPATRMRRAEPATPTRRAEAAPRVRRAEPTTRVRRAEPATPTRRAEAAPRVRRADPPARPQRREARPERRVERNDARAERSSRRPAEERASRSSSAKSSGSSGRSRERRR